MKVFAFFGVLVLFAIVNALVDNLTGWTEGGSEFAKITHHDVGCPSVLPCPQCTREVEHLKKIAGEK